MMTRTSEKSLAEEYRNMLLLIEKHRGIMEREGQYAFCRGWIDLKQAWLEGRHIAFALKLLKLSVNYPLLTGRRLILALPNIGLNRDFSQFHLRPNRSTES
jgi:hypothetical protein